MPPKRAAGRARGPRLSAVAESPVRMEDEEDPAEEVPLEMAIDEMEIDSNHGGDDDDEGLMNEVEDDYGPIVPVDYNDEDLLRIDNPVVPEDVETEEDLQLPLRQRGIGLNVRMKYSRIRPEMTRKEKVIVSEAKGIKKCICEAFRSVFQARDNINQVLLAASHKLVLCYKKALNARGQELNMLNVFFQHLDLRLTMIFDETSLSENRGRVYKLCATVALELVVLGFYEDMLLFLLDFIEQFSTHPDAPKRANAAIFACFIFETGMSRKRGNNNNEEDPDHFCELELGPALRNFMVLKKGLLDKESKVRCPAIRGLSVIQTVSLPSSWPEDALEASPKELIIRSIHDKAWECRLTAIKHLAFDLHDVQLICNVISYDKSTAVRVAGLEKLGEMKPSWSPRLVAPLMVTVFRDHEVQVRDAAKGTLRAWIAHIADRYRETRKKAAAKTADDDDIIVTKDMFEEEGAPEKSSKGKAYIMGVQALVLVFYINTPMFPENQSQLRRLVQHMLEVLRTMYHAEQDMIGTFVDQINDDVNIVKNSAALPLIMRSTISSLLEDGDVVEGQDLNTTRSLVFFWRCFIEFIVDKSHHEADKTLSLSRLLYPLKTMVDHFDVFLLRVKHEEQNDPQLLPIQSLDADVYVMQMSLVENYMCAMRHAESEHAGKNAYKNVLQQMMMNPFYQKKVLDLIFQELATFYHDCPEELLSMFKANITKMRFEWKGGSEAFPVINHAILVGSKKFEDEWKEEERLNGISRLDQGKRFIDQYEVKVLNCILKTGLLRNWDNEYESRYGRMLRDQIATTSNISTKVNAIECLGMIGTYHFDLVKDDFSAFIRDWDHLGSETMKATVVTCLTEMYLMNQDALIAINQIIDREHPKPDVNDLRPFLGEILVDESAQSGSELLLRSVEAFCRILMNSKMSPDDVNAQRSIVSLMHRASLKLTDTYDAKLRSVILTTLSLFSGMVQRNQLLIVHTFPLFFQSFLRNQHIVGLVNDKEDVLTKLKRVGACFVSLTRHSCLPPSVQQNTTPAQLTLARAILEEVGAHANSELVEFYLSALPHIEFETFEPTEQRKLFGDLENTIQLHDDQDAQDRARISELRKAKKKLARLIGINEDEDLPMAEPSSSTAAAAPASRTESRSSMRPPPRGRRGATATPAFSMSSRAGSVAMTDGGMDDDDGMEEEDEVPREDRRAAARKKAAAAKSVQDMMASPEAKNVRKPPSRPATATRPTRAPSTRSAAATPLRTSSRRLNQE